MNAEIEQAWARANEMREQRLKDWRGTLSMEERLSQLEEYVIQERERLWLVELPEYDARFAEHHSRIEKVRQENWSRSDEVLDRILATEAHVKAELGKTIEKLVAESNSAVVTAGLVEALKRIVVKTRPATREEARTGEGVVAIRQATPEEMRSAGKEHGRQLVTQQ